MRKTSYELKQNRKFLSWYMGKHIPEVKQKTKDNRKKKEEAKKINGSSSGSN